MTMHQAKVVFGTTRSSLSVVVELKGKDGSSFVGWTGMPATLQGFQQSAQGDTIELDPLLARELHLRQDQKIAYELHLELLSARIVNVSPVSADDWEILEMHAEFIESNLLSQVRAASAGQTICVWVGKSKTLIRFSVDSVEPATERAVRLTNDTEVIVAPRTRQKPTQIQPSATKEPERGPKKAEAELRRHLFRVLPSECLASTSKAAPPKADALVSPSLFARIEAAHPSTRCAVQLVARPRSTKQDAKEGEAEATSLATVYVQSDRGVPAEHVWLSDAAREQLGLTGLGKDGTNGYQLVRFCNVDKPKPKRSTSNEPPTSPAKSPKLSPTLQPTIMPSFGAALANGHAEPTPAPLIGVDKELEAARSHIVNALQTRRSGFSTSGLLVCGASGSGKSVFAQAIGHAMAVDSRVLAHVQVVDCGKLSDERVPALKDKIKDWLDEAYWHAPTVLILDNVDRMVPAEVEHVDPFRVQHLAAVFVAALKSALAERPIVLVATAQSPASLNQLILSSHLLGERVMLKAPDKAVRRQLLDSLVSIKSAATELRAGPTLDYVALATQTEGYLPADLRDLVDRAVHQAAIRSAGKEAGLELLPADFAAAQQDFVPLSLRDVKLQKSEVQWSDIGGLRETRRVLRETLEWPTKYGAIFANCPLRLRSGLLLYGFPGCGKTLLASAVAKECGLNFISVKGPELLNKYIGASEKSVRDLFDRASAAKPCVLFFDEFDSIAPKRGHDSTGVTDRVVNQLLTQMDGAEGLDGVYVLAATSRPDLIDPALLRPGRLDKSLLCGMPDQLERHEIMQACARKLHLSDLVDLQEYAELTDGYTGADLQALVYNAHLDALHESISDDRGGKQANGTDEVELQYTTFGGQEGKSVLSRAEKGALDKRLQTILQSVAPRQAANGVSTVTPRATTYIEPSNMRRALQTTRPSVPQNEIARLKRIYDSFVSARSSEGGLPSGEASHEIGGRSSLM